MNGAPFDPETMRRLGPKYWRDEVSGKLARAVHAYLGIGGRELTAEHVALLRAYFRQWVGAPIWDANPHQSATDVAELAGLRDAVGSLTNRAQIRAWLRRALDAGIDPL
jgi:hypothetical protein